MSTTKLEMATVAKKVDKKVSFGSMGEIQLELNPVDDDDKISLGLTHQTSDAFIKLRTKRSSVHLNLVRNATTAPMAEREDSCIFGTCEIMYVPDAAPGFLAVVSSTTVRCLHKCWPNYRWHVYHPNSRLRFAWDIAALFMMFYLLISVPIRLIFPRAEVDPFSFWGILNLLVDLFFFVDVIFNLKTGLLENDGSVVVFPDEVIRRYMVSWFFIDFVTCIPLDHILYDSSFSSSNSDLIKFPRLFKIVKYLRLIRMTKITKVFDVIDAGDSSRSLERAIKTAKFFIIMYIAIHCCACLWMLAAVVHREGGAFAEESWPISGLGLDSINVEKASWQTMYVVSIYWSAIALTTVGFGDITPQNLTEMLVTMVIALLGTMFFAYVVGSISSFIVSSDFLDAQREEKLDQLKSFLTESDVPTTLRSRVLRQHRYATHDVSSFQRSEWLAELPDSLREDVTCFLHKNVMETVPLFRELGKKGFLSLIPRLRQVHLLEDEYVYCKGAEADNLYVVVKGILTVGESHAKEIYKVAQGSYFGDLELFANTPRTVSVLTVTKVELLECSKEVFLEVIAEHPEVHKAMLQESMKRSASFYKHSVVDKVSHSRYTSRLKAIVRANALTRKASSQRFQTIATLAKLNKDDESKMTPLERRKSELATEKIVEEETKQELQDLRNSQHKGKEKRRSSILTFHDLATIHSDDDSKEGENKDVPSGLASSQVEALTSRIDSLELTVRRLTALLEKKTVEELKMSLKMAEGVATDESSDDNPDVIPEVVDLNGQADNPDVIPEVVDLNVQAEVEDPN